MLHDGVRDSIAPTLHSTDRLQSAKSLGSCSACIYRHTKVYQFILVQNRAQIRCEPGSGSLVISMRARSFVGAGTFMCKPVVLLGLPYTWRIPEIGKLQYVKLRPAPLGTAKCTTGRRWWQRWLSPRARLRRHCHFDDHALPRRYALDPVIRSWVKTKLTSESLLDTSISDCTTPRPHSSSY